jgi:CBS domain-containing protein
MDMVVRDFMAEPPISILPTTTVADAADLMARRRVGFLPVVCRGLIIGVITDRDIVVRSTALGTDPAETRVDAIMSRSPATVSPETEVEEALRIMRVRRLRRLPVVELGILVGIVTLSDLADASVDPVDYEATVAVVSEAAG